MREVGPRFIRFVSMFVGFVVGVSLMLLESRLEGPCVAVVAGSSMFWPACTFALSVATAFYWFTSLKEGQ